MSETTKPDAVDAYLASRGVRWDAENGGYMEGEVTVSSAWEEQPRSDHAIEAITHTLGWCGCGMPGKALAWLRDVLVHLHALHSETRPWPERWEEYQTREAAMFPTRGAQYFAYYTLDAMKLTEHGSSVPGWLSPRGTLLHDALVALLPKEADNDHA